MSIDESHRATYLTGLRHELKKWEKHFAAANAGRKPGREDIKQDATISAKYREYDQLRKLRSEQYSVETPRKHVQRQSSPKKRQALMERSANPPAVTPRKDSKALQTLAPPELSPVHEEEQTPAFIRCALGPTPQKNGQILGIFDMLKSATPSRPATAPVPVNDSAVAGTPSKPTAPTSSDPTLSRTPQSSSKRRYLEAFAGTPLKRKRDENDVGTPSTAKKQYATPAFLRRSFPLAPIDEDATEPITAAPPFKKRSLVRSLSTIIQGLKKQEEKRMDDEWDVLNELEGEENGESQPKVLVEDSQVLDMPLGPDQGPDQSDEETVVDPGALDANGRPRKVWKKKGLKRQTRRVIMRPVTHKAKKAAGLAEPDGSGDEAVEETQQAELRPRTERKAAQAEDGAEAGSGVESEYLDDDPMAQKEVEVPKFKVKRKKQRSDSDIGAERGTGEVEKESTTKKAARKVSAQAHANFRKLKIKNKNSKANGRGGRFGRR